MRTLIQDLRFALRQMVKRPGLTAVVVVTMALAIGANASIFSVLDAVLLKPLPYQNPQELVTLWSRFKGIGLPNDQNWVSAPEFRDFQQLNRSFSSLAAMESGSANLGLKGNPQRVIGALVSPSLFGILGVQPVLGRAFRSGEAQPGHDHEVILSSGLWKRMYGANPDIVGKALDVNGVPMTVIGIMPAGFAYPHGAEFWAPLAFSPHDLSEKSRGNHGLRVLGRIKPGLSLAQVRSDMDRVANTIIEQHPDYPYTRVGFAIILHPLLQETVGDVKTPLLLLMAAVGLVLLIACANTANLLLTRSTERQQEMETRLALGASGWRLARQLLTESVALSLAGGLVGLAITPSILHGLVAVAAKSLPRTVHTGIDVGVLMFTLAACLVVGILFGLFPAWQVARRRNFDALKSGRSTEGIRSKRLRSVLVICETAFSLLLLAGTGLLLRSFAEILKVDPGFRPEGVLTMRISLPEVLYSKPEQVRGFYSNLLGRVRRLPGVRSAGAVSSLPLAGGGSSGTVTIDTQSVPLENTFPEADQRIATPEYFRAMGISLLRGRFFQPGDSAGAPPVAIIDQNLAQTFWPNQNPIGKRLHQGGSSPNPSWTTVVGVVKSVRNRTLESRSRVEVYWPENQKPARSMTLAVHVLGNPMNLAPTIEKEVAAIDPSLPVYHVQTMTEVMSDSVQRRELALILLAVFAGLAIVLTSIGIYGVSSYRVAQRQAEIGLRMALGADRLQMMSMTIRQGMASIAIGLGLGLILALSLTQMVGSLLFKVRSTDPLSLLASAAILAGVAFIAILIPALRATKVEPAVALRWE